MATAPIKSQPLHNFSLPHLRWAHRNPHHHHHHQQQQQQQPQKQQELQQHPRHSTVNRFRRRDPPEFDGSTAKPSSRAPHNPQPFYSSFSSASHQNQRAEQNDDAAEEGEKPWKLRPRKVVTTTTSSLRRSEREKEKLREEDDETRSYWRNNNSNNESSVLLKSSSASRSRGTTAFGVVGTERQQRKVVEEKRKLWISLSKEEIEEDVYSLTGSRPSRRPKKRPRNVQKQLDQR